MIVVRILGGLGNQMAQYAFFLKLRSVHKNVKIDKSSYYSAFKSHNGYELKKVFGIKGNSAAIKEIEALSVYKNIRLVYCVSRIARVLFLYNIIKKFAKRSKITTLSEEPHQQIEESGNMSFRGKIVRFAKRCFGNVLYLVNESGFISQTHFIEPAEFYGKHLQHPDIYYEGFWQNIDYYSDVLDTVTSCFTFKGKLRGKNKKLLEFISTSEVCSVSIHVRRGDYVDNPGFDNVSAGYFERAVERLEEQLHIEPDYVVFSDDIEWVKENSAYLNDRKCHWVDWNKGKNSYKDMWLMSRCTHNIIVNSSFSWWASLLNPNREKIIIVPKQYAQSAPKFPKGVMYFMVDN